MFRTRPRITPQQGNFATIAFGFAFSQDASKRRNIAKTQVHSLPGEGVNDVPGVAHQRDSRRNQTLGRKLHQRQNTGGPQRAQLAETPLYRVGHTSGQGIGS